jgi:hypothetical protein
MNAPLRLSTKPKTPRTRRCKVKSCGAVFKSYDSFVSWCSPGCGVAIGLKKLEAQRRKEARNRALAAMQAKREHKAKLEDAKRPQDLKAQVQKLANKCARLRDELDGCISCDRPATWDGQWHGSHYKATGANSALRFNLWNIHKACSVCNNYKSGNIADYYPRLVAKVGQERVDWLDAHERSRKYPVEWLKKAKRVFGKLAKRYERRLEDLKGRAG